MTTGHAPEAEPTAAEVNGDGAGDGGNGTQHPSLEPDPVESEWTGELQVIDVDDAEDDDVAGAGEAGDEARASATESEPEPAPGGIPETNEMPVVDAEALPPMVEPPKRVRTPVWKVPVLTSKRDRSQPPPPDAVRSEPPVPSEPESAANEPAVTERVPVVAEAPAPEAPPQPEPLARPEPQAQPEAEVAAQPEPSALSEPAETSEPVATSEGPLAEEAPVAGPPAPAPPVGYEGVSPEVLAEPMVELVPAGAGGDGGLGPRARRRIEAQRARVGRVRKQRTFTVAAMAMLIVAGGGLAGLGYKEVRGSTGGKYVDNQLQPDEPGYVALVTPTPTLLVVHKGPANELAGVSLLSLRSQDQGGSVLVMPVSTVAPFADQGTTFTDVYAGDGAEALANQVEFTLNIVVAETVEVDDVRWATLVGPVAPLEVDIDAPAGDFVSGANELTGDQVGPFLETRDDDEAELARLDRQELFWEAWLPAVAGAGESAVPGEVDVGLGRFVRGLAAGDFEVTGLPVAAAFSAAESYSPDEEMLPSVVSAAVPYPQEPSRGSRVQTQLLNGTTQVDLSARAATPLVAGGAEIALAGNAASFDEPTTRFVYTDTKTRDDAEKLRDAFGVGEVEQAPGGEESVPVEEDRIDVTVILGADALDALGG